MSLRISDTTRGTLGTRLCQIEDRASRIGMCMWPYGMACHKYRDCQCLRWCDSSSEIKFHALTFRIGWWGGSETYNHPQMSPNESWERTGAGQTRTKRNGRQREKKHIERVWRSVFDYAFMLLELRSYASPPQLQGYRSWGERGKCEENRNVY